MPLPTVKSLFVEKLSFKYRLGDFSSGQEVSSLAHMMPVFEDMILWTRAMEYGSTWRCARLDFGKCVWESVTSLETDCEFDVLVETPSVHCSRMLCGMKGKDRDKSTV